jgi:hypothetical protein
MTIKSWTRLEPVSRDPTMADGLQARIADPLWLLARQAQFGEFAGEDAASPVIMRLRAHYSQLTRIRDAWREVLAPGPHENEPPGSRLAVGIPIEPIAEAEPEPSESSPRLLSSAQAGLSYLQMLDNTGNPTLTAYRNALAGAYPFPPPRPGEPAPGPPAPDPADLALRPFVGRVPDGATLARDLAAALPAGRLPANPPLGDADATVVTDVARRWLAWCNAVTGQELGAPQAWNPARMEYAFHVAGPGPDQETILATSDNTSERLDWYSFDVVSSTRRPTNATLGAVGQDLPGADRPNGDRLITFSAVPRPVTYPGMPNSRWWTFEDAAVDFGEITAPAENIATSLIVEFALRYGNDHFLAPVRLPVGGLLRIDSLVVVDTFGETIAIQPVADVEPDGQFRLFELTMTPDGGDHPPPREPLLVLLPTVVDTLSGGPLEEVHYLRDEAAEIVWAVEKMAPGPAGIPIHRDVLESPPPAPAAPPDADQLTYVPRTGIKGNWFPFIAPDTTIGAPLQRTEVAPLDGSAPPQPWGVVLSSHGKEGLPSEEVTRAGVQLVRRWRYARSENGRQLSWVHRRTLPGRGQGASSLRFDLAE